MFYIGKNAISYLLVAGGIGMNCIHLTQDLLFAMHIGFFFLLRITVVTVNNGMNRNQADVQFFDNFKQFFMVIAEVSAPLPEGIVAFVTLAERGLGE